MFKNFLLKKMLKSQLKGIPEAEQERIINVVIKNPDFFKKIGDEIQEKVKGGMDQTMATMRTMEKYKAEMQKLMQ